MAMAEQDVQVKKYACDEPKCKKVAYAEGGEAPEGWYTGTVDIESADSGMWASCGVAHIRNAVLAIADEADSTGGPTGTTNPPGAAAGA